MSYVVTICICSDDSINDLLDRDEIDYTVHPLMEAVIRKISPTYRSKLIIKPYEELSKESKYYIDLCVDFLLWIRDNETSGTSLFGFVRHFLKLKDGIDYLLMNLLDWYDFSTHGIAIRYSYIHDKYSERKCPEERAKQFTEWAAEIEAAAAAAVQTT